MRKNLLMALLLSAETIHVGDYCWKRAHAVNVALQLFPTTAKLRRAAAVRLYVGVNCRADLLSHIPEKEPELCKRDFFSVGVQRPFGEGEFGPAEEPTLHRKARLD